MNDSTGVAIPADFGPIYFETDLGRAIAEPWNAISSLTFLIPVTIFLWKLKGKYGSHLFIILFCSPLLTAGGLGSTLFHAFRSSRLFLLMDILPILFLTTGVSVYFMYRLSRNWYVPALVILGSLGLRWLTRNHFEGQAAINMYYTITGALIFVPAALFIRRTQGHAWKWILSSTIAFSLALLFRYTDDFRDPGLPMGTHWLWHAFCAMGAYALGMYIIRVSDKNEGNASHRV